MGSTPMNSGVLFEVADVTFNWWFCWPMCMFLVATGAFAAIGYALCESLPHEARRFLQRVCLGAGLLGAGLLLVLVGLITGLDWMSFHRLQFQREHGDLKVVEGEFTVGRLAGYRSESGSGNYTNQLDPFTTFKITGSSHQQHEFAWKLTRGKSFTDASRRIRRGDRLRVKFVPEPAKQVQRALCIEKLSPTR